MPRDELPILEVCSAGREADFRGRWTKPCPNYGRHILAFSDTEGGPMTPGAPIYRFCDQHIAELGAAGLIDEWAVPADEWNERVRKGRGQ